MRCSWVAYAQYAPSSRLVRRAPRRSRCNAGFHHGLPDPAEAGTSLVERWNLTLRPQNARYQRKPLAFSKSLEQHLNSWPCGCCTTTGSASTGTLGTIPAVAAGLIKHRWSEAWIAELAELYHESARDVERRAAAARADRQRVH